MPIPLMARTHYVQIIKIQFDSMRNGLLQIKKSGNKLAYKLNDIQPTSSIRVINNITKLFFDEKDNTLLIGTKNAGLLKATLYNNGDIKNIESISKLSQEKNEHVWSILKASIKTFI